MSTKICLLLMSILLFASCGNKSTTQTSASSNSLQESTEVPEDNSTEMLIKKLDPIKFTVTDEQIAENADAKTLITSKPYTFSLSKNAKSFILQIESSHLDLVGLTELVDPNGNVYIQDAYGTQGSYNNVNYYSNTSLASVQFPFKTETEIVPGEWTFRVFTKSLLTQLPTINTTLITRRHEISDTPIINIQPIMSTELLAPQNLESALTKLTTELKILGFEVDISETIVASDTTSRKLYFNNMGISDATDLLTLSNSNKLNVYFVDDIILPGSTETGDKLRTLGVTGVKISSNSSDYTQNYIAINISANDSAFYYSDMGGVIAHEIGHYLGLRHTSERSGDKFDTLDDTPECPIENDSNGDGIVDGIECANAGGDNFMFWLTEVNVIRITEQQFFIMQHCPFTK